MAIDPTLDSPVSRAATLHPASECVFVFFKNDAGQNAVTVTLKLTNGSPIVTMLLSDVLTPTQRTQLGAIGQALHLAAASQLGFTG